jgi:hypothetical protein
LLVFQRTLMFEAEASSAAVDAGLVFVASAVLGVRAMWKILLNDDSNWLFFLLRYLTHEGKTCQLLFELIF